MNILIADDHLMVLEMLKEFVESEIPDSVVHTAGDYPGLEKKLTSEVIFDLVIMDFKMPGVNGLRTIRNLMTSYKHMSIAIMSGVANKSEILEFLNLGVIGFIPKTSPPQVTVSAIQIMLNGERYIPSMLMDEHSSVNDSSKVESVNEMTPREMEVLSKLHLGYSNKDIGRSLSIQEVTVKMYISRLCKKLNASNRTHLVVEAMKLGLIE